MDLDLASCGTSSPSPSSLHFGRAADELHIAKPGAQPADPRAGKRFGTPLLTGIAMAWSLADAGRQLLDRLRPRCWPPRTR